MSVNLMKNDILVPCISDDFTDLSMIMRYSGAY